MANNLKSGNKNGTVSPQNGTNVLPVIKIPINFTIPSIDISKIQGHICTQAKMFKMIREELPVLSGDYYQTKLNGDMDWVDNGNAPIDLDSQNKYRTKKNKKTEVLYFYNYSQFYNYVDLIFDPQKNVFNVKKKIKFALYKVFDDKGNELPYDADTMSGSAEVNYNFVMQQVKAEHLQFLKATEVKVSQILNQKGYYLTPSRCNKSGGCSCKIPVVFNVEYEFSQVIKDDVIRLFEDSKRADASNFSMVERTVMEYKKIINNKKVKVKEIWEYEATVTYAHETGHHFGFPDEYFEGGGGIHKMYINPTTLLVDTKMKEPANDWKREGKDNLMSTRGVDVLPVIPSYYYEIFRKKFEQKTGIEMEIKC